MELWLVFTAVGVVVGAIIIYLMFMIFLPEWVGITGKIALEAERSHRGNSEAGPDVIARMEVAPRGGGAPGPGGEKPPGDSSEG